MEVSFKNNSLLNLIYIMPDDIKYMIKQYLDVLTIIFTNKNNYMIYHKYLRPYIIKNHYENYIRSIIKKDYEFVFKQLIYENCDKWILLKGYVYKNNIYKNYIFFLINFCIENESVKCCDMITKILAQQQLCQNRHKKNIIKCIK